MAPTGKLTDHTDSSVADNVDRLDKCVCRALKSFPFATEGGGRFEPGHIQGSMVRIAHRETPLR